MNSLCASFKALITDARTDEGDVKRLVGESGVFRLRIGDWRVRFTQEERGMIVLLGVKNRSQAYR